MTTEERLIDIELALTAQQRMLDELNEAIIFQTKEIEKLKKESALLATMLKEDMVKPLSEETPPPHY